MSMENAAIELRTHRDFINTEYIRNLSNRAFRYLELGFAVHLSGPSGTGKTTLALHLADMLGRPTVLLMGDDSYESTDLIGHNVGYYRKRVIDNYVNTVLKTEDDLRQTWVDNRLTLACKEGLTLIYDEFNRSCPETNNVLLSILEEKLLILPTSEGGTSYIKVHPNFRAIFTSNPEEYAGVHDTQEALLDRMVTMHTTGFDRDTELRITVGRSGLAPEKVELIVDLVRNLRKQFSGWFPTVRASIMISQVVSSYGMPVGPESEFLDVCCDICSSQMKTVTKEGDLRRAIQSALGSTDTLRS